MSFARRLTRISSISLISVALAACGNNTVAVAVPTICTIPRPHVTAAQKEIMGADRIEVHAEGKPTHVIDNVPVIFEPAVDWTLGFQKAWDRQCR